MRIFWQQPSWYISLLDCSGAFAFLVKVKAHRGEPANEGANILAYKAISDPKLGKEWCQLTNRAAFTCKKLRREAGSVSYDDRHSTFDNSVLRGAAENEVQNMKRSLQVLGDKWAHSGDDMKSGVEVIAGNIPIAKWLAKNQTAIRCKL